MLYLFPAQTAPKLPSGIHTCRKSPTLKRNTYLWAKHYPPTFPHHHHHRLLSTALCTSFPPLLPLPPSLPSSLPPTPIPLPSLSSYFPAPLPSPLPLSLLFPPPSGQERLLQVEHKIRERSESPVVPPVGESVEIVTAPPDQDHTAMQQFDGASFKRAATGSLNWERLAAKNPRLTEG